jgi:hypothetical protein
VCAQAPIRDDAFAACEQPALRAHWARLDAILSAHGYRFHNLHGELALGRECFADYSHLNAEGARRFTEALLARCGSELGLAQPVAAVVHGHPARPAVAMLRDTRDPRLLATGGRGPLDPRRLPERTASVRAAPASR